VLPVGHETEDLVAAVEGGCYRAREWNGTVEYRDTFGEGGAADRELQVALVGSGGGDERACRQALQVEARGPGADFVRGAEVGIRELYHPPRARDAGEGGRGAAGPPVDHECLQ